jgi:hypothetical protein
MSSILINGIVLSSVARRTKQNMRNKNIIGITLVIATVLMLVSTGIAMAAVWTDQADYTPGSIVTISGNNNDNAGYLAGETVNLHVDGPSSYDSSCSSIADSSGAWSCQITLVSTSAAEGSYNYTAVGQTSNVTQSGTFTDANVVHFVESGLPTGTTWSAAMPSQNPSTKSSTTNTISYGGVSSSITPYSYSIGSPISGGTGTQYVASPSSGSIVVNGATVTQNINFATQYQVTFAVSPTGSGTTQTSGWYNSGSNSISATANTGYVFSSWSSTSAITITSATSSSTTATINGPGTITANFVLSDSIAPTTTPTLNPAAPNGANGWYKTNVHVTIAASDNTGGSGVAETRCELDPATPPSSFNDIAAGCSYIGTGADVTEGQHTIYYASKDNAGNIEGVQNNAFKVDTTPPTISGAPTTLANANGWYNTDVLVHFTASDSISGIDTVTPDQTLSNDGSSQGVTGTVTDKAGNTASATVGSINIDKTPPTVQVSKNPEPNTNGWNNGPVTVTIDATDSLSGIDGSATQSNTLSSEGANQKVDYSFTDKAGNTVTSSATGINIDLTPPTISGAPTTLANANGWYNTNVVVHFTAGDSLSGIDTVTPDQTLSNEGSSQSVTGTVTDKAGNTASATVGSINIDKTPPLVTITAPGSTYILNQPVPANFNCDGSISGIDTCTGTVANGANIDTSSVGTKTFTVTSADKAGNSKTVTDTYKVQYSSTLGRTILQPLQQVSDPSGLTKSYKISSTLPIKLQLADYNGQYVGTAIVTLSISKWSGSTDAADAEITLTSTTGDTGNILRYDPTGQQYIYNLKTTGYSIGYYKIVASPDDGSPATVSYFEMKK